MAMRTSSRERIARRAQEAAIGAQEKTPKAASKRAGVKAKTPAKERSARRMKSVWKVFNDNMKEVACFPYPERERAAARAAELTRKTGKEHFVNEIKVPMEAGA